MQSVKNNKFHFVLTINKKKQCYVLKSKEHEVPIDSKYGTFTLALYYAIKELKKKHGIVTKKYVSKKIKCKK